MNSKADKLCKNFQSKEGCKYGSSCKFSHNIPQSADNDKTKICKYFNSQEGCSYGDRCKFIHTKISNLVSTDLVKIDWTKTRRIGIDCGGVIIAKTSTKKGEDTGFFSDNFLNTPQSPGCFETIKQLVDKYGNENIFVVPKASEKIIDKTKKWMDHHKFYEQTGVKSDNIHFCKTRQDKLPLCEKLDIDCFIDDHFDVLEIVSKKCQGPLIYFGENSLEKKSSDKFYAVKEWKLLSLS